MREIHWPLATVLHMLVWRQRIVALLRILCGCLCAFDAGYRWLTVQDSSLRLSFVHVAWFAAWPWLPITTPHLLALCVAAAETVIASALICGALTNLVCTLAISLTLLGCIGNTGTGALTLFFGPGYFDLGILLVAILTFLGLSLGSAGQTYGVDHWLVSKLGHWSFLASRSDDFFSATQDAATFSLPAVPTLALTCTRAAPFPGEPETHRTDSAGPTLAPKERQRVLFM